MPASLVVPYLFSHNSLVSQLELSLTLSGVSGIASLSGVSGIGCVCAGSALKALAIDRYLLVMCTSPYCEKSELCKKAPLANWFPYLGGPSAITLDLACPRLT